MRSCFWVKLPLDPKPRTKLSVKVGVLAGVIWGLFFAGYYSMLPNYKFALLSATVGFVVLVIFVFTWPSFVRAFKDAAEEGRKKREGNQ